MDGKISNFAQIASVRRYTITEGREAGLSVIDCDNGKIRFLLNVSKALDIMQLYHEGQNVSFLSKNAFVASEKSFLSRFEGGMLYTCGLDSVGGGREGFELHGMFHNNPASVTRAECTEEGIVIEATIRQTKLFGENLVIRRRIKSVIGSETLSVEDVLENEGYTDAQYTLLYHVNLGYPMLDEGCKIVSDAYRCVTRDAWAKENVPTRTEIKDSVAGEAETCYYLTHKTPEISLVNPRLGKTFTLTYSGDTLTNFVQWKSMASGDYALGFEPSTTDLDDLFTYKTIRPQEKISFRISLTVSKNV